MQIIIRRMLINAVWLIGAMVFLICLFGFVGIQSDMENNMIAINAVNIAKATAYALISFVLLIKFIFSTINN